MRRERKRGRESVCERKEDREDGRKWDSEGGEERVCERKGDREDRRKREREGGG